MQGLISRRADRQVDAERVSLLNPLDQFPRQTLQQIGVKGQRYRFVGIEHRYSNGVAMPDLLGDIMVYCRSEALKYGLPLEEVLDVIMDSNESKLGADGKPIYDANGKFLKGPDYWKAQPKMQCLLEKNLSSGS